MLSELFPDYVSSFPRFSWSRDAVGPCVAVLFSSKSTQSKVSVAHFFKFQEFLVFLANILKVLACNIFLNVI